VTHQSQTVQVHVLKSIGRLECVNAIRMAGVTFGRCCQPPSRESCVARCEKGQGRPNSLVQTAGQLCSYLQVKRLRHCKYSMQSRHGCCRSISAPLSLHSPSARFENECPVPSRPTLACTGIPTQLSWLRRHSRSIRTTSMGNRLTSTHVASAANVSAHRRGPSGSALSVGSA
jgi:hypothetical protein